MGKCKQNKSFLPQVAFGHGVSPWRFESIIIMLQVCGVQIDEVLEKDLRVLHIDPQTTGSSLRHWMHLEHRKP